MKRQMKRIRNGLVTALLALMIAGGGMAGAFFLLERVERQALRKETADNQEEIVLTEEETDRLVMLLKALEDDRLTRIRSGNGANIPEEKARSMMTSALEEMNVLMLEGWMPDIRYLIDVLQQIGRCELYADQNNFSVEVYKITYLYRGNKNFYFEITGMLDASSGLLVSLNLSFLGEEEWEEKNKEENSGISADYEEYSALYSDIYDRKAYSYYAEDLQQEYPLDFLLDSALGYYSMNTNFDFSLPKEYEVGADYYRMDSRDGEYYIELTRDHGDFHFQLHKFDL